MANDDKWGSHHPTLEELHVGPDGGTMVRMDADAGRASEQEALAAVRAGDESAFGDLVEPYRRQLHIHCYRMLGSLHDADDALQETPLAAWRGISGFEGRSSAVVAEVGITPVAAGRRSGRPSGAPGERRRSLRAARRATLPP
jgi:hypothetical protein